MIVLTYKSTTTIPVEAECLTPENLAGKSLEEIRHLPVQHGNRVEELGEFFRIEGDGSDLNLRIEGDCSRVKLIGANMTKGTITIHGQAGMHLGAEMSGGSIHVHGNVGDWVGAEMSGGLIHVRGDAGHLAGAGYRGSRYGMRGGALLIEGSAGNEIGSTMRRGLIAIGKESGDFAGVGMIAGSLFLFGPTGLRAGAGIKRGTVVLFESGPKLLPTFHYDCNYRPIFLRMYLRKLQQWGFPLREAFFQGTFKRYSGDLVGIGRGELLHWQPPG